MNEPTAGIWTDDEIAIVLAHVSVAYWGRLVSSPPHIDEAPKWSTSSKANSTHFVVEMTNGEFHTFSTYKDGYGARDHQEMGVEFLRALQLYWETRT